MAELPSVGKYEDLNKESKNIVEGRENFDGFHLEFSRMLSRNFELAHFISFGSQTEPASYQMAPRYFSQGFLLDGKLSPGPLFFNGDVQGRIHIPLSRNPKRRTTLRLTGVVPKPSNKPVNSQLSVELDVRGSDYTGQFRWHNSGIWDAAYSQSVHKNCALGVMGYFDERQGTSLVTGSLRYHWEESNARRIVTGSVGDGHFSASYTQVSPDQRKTWTTEAQFVRPQGHPSWEAAWTGGFEYMLTHARVKARVDSNLCASCLLEETVLQPISLMICGDMNYKKDVYKVGFGFSFRF